MKQYLFITTILTITIQSYTQNVGINTANPDRPLTIKGNGIHNELISFRNNGDTTHWHINMRKGGLNFVQTGIADYRIFLDSNGSTGIGTSSPVFPLHIVTNKAVSTPLTLQTIIGGNSGQLTSLRFRNTISLIDSTSEMFSSAIGGGRGPGNDSYLAFATSPNQNAPAEKMRIDGNGNVGIGTNAPATSLQVNGGIASTPANFTVVNTAETINPGNRSYIRVTNNTGLTSVITLADGLADGQMLTILAQAGNVFSIIQFSDNPANNTQLSSAFNMGQDDTLQLIWDAARSAWIEIHRSAN